VDERLFSERQWPAGWEDSAATRDVFEKLGLQESSGASSCNTTLGNELKLDLIMVFAGQWVEWEMPGVLEEYGLIDEFERERLYELLAYSRNPEQKLRKRVQKAYLRHFNPSGRLV
jgi:hypothetical protein